MKKSLFLLVFTSFFLLFFTSFILAILYYDYNCYQETATTGTSCGGLATGTYTCAGSWDTDFPCLRAYDGNWGTGATSTAAGSYLYINYSKPTGAVAAKWLIQSAAIGSPTNYTLPAACFNQNKISLQAYLDYDAADEYYYCWSGSSWTVVKQDLLNGGERMYEEAIYWNMTIPNIAPLIPSNIKEPSDPSTYSPSANYQFNATMCDADGATELSIINFQWNNINSSVTTYGAINTTCREYYTTKMDLANATYNYSWFVNDSSNAQNSSSLATFSVSQATPTFSTSVTSPLTYETASNYAGSESNSVDTDCAYALYRNGTIIASGNSVSDNTILGFGVYNYTYAQNSSSCTNFTAASDTKILTVNKKSALNFAYPPTQTVTYPTSVLQYYTTAATISVPKLYRNHVEITNGTSIILAAGVYTYTVNITDTANYTLWSDTETLTVNTANQSLSLTGITNSTYPYSVTPSCSGNTTSNLYRNNSAATNDTAIQLGVGSYLWTCNTTANENYTFNSVSVLQVVSIGTPSISVGSLATVTHPAKTQTGCERITGDPSSILTLLRNGTQVNQSATSPINESLITLGAGLWSYTCTLTNTENYTSALSANNYRTVNQNASTAMYMHIELNGTLDANETYTYPQAVNGTVYTTGISGSAVSPVFKFYRDNTLIYSGVMPSGSSYTNISVLSAGTHIYTINTTGDQNYTAVGVIWYANINAASATIDLFLNGTTSNITIPNNTVVNATVLSNDTFAVMYLYSDVVNVGVGSSPFTTLISYSGTDSIINVSASLSSNYTYNISTHYIILDASYPLISFVKPENITYGTMSVPIEAYVSKNSSISYSINNTANKTLCKDCISNSTTEILENGFYNITFFWNSSANYNSTTIYFSVNTIFPSVVISRPQSLIYPSNPIQINLTISENCTVKYSWNSTKNETVCQNCSEFGNSSLQYLPTLSDGVYTLRIYLNDSNGRFATDFVVFSLSTPIITTTIPQLGGGGATPTVLGNATTFSIFPSLGYTLSVIQGQTQIISGIGRSGSSFTITNKGPDTIHLKAYATGNESSWVKFLFPLTTNGTQTTTDVIYFDIPSGGQQEIISQISVPINETTGKEAKIQFNFQDVNTAAYNTVDVVAKVGPAWWKWIWDVGMRAFQFWTWHIPGKFSFDVPIYYRIIGALFALWLFPKVLNMVKQLKDKRATKSLILLSLICIILFIG